MSQCFNRLVTYFKTLHHSADTQWDKFQKLSFILQLAWLRSLKVYQPFPHTHLQACLVKFSETPTQSKWRCTRKNSKILRRHNFSAPCYQLFLFIVNYAYNSPDKFSKLGKWETGKVKKKSYEQFGKVNAAFRIQIAMRQLWAQRCFLVLTCKSTTETN